MTTDFDDLMPEPRRSLNKQEAARHLIHSAIRLIGRMEDPFAIHLLVHSADKILLDLAKGRGEKLQADWELYIKEEYRAEFFRRHREAYNYFKHADRDFATDLPVRDIMMANVYTLFMCVVNYEQMFGERTHHMTLIYSLVMALIPEIIEPTGMQGVELLKGARDMQTMTPEFFFQTFEEHPEALPNFYPELAKDLQDFGHFYKLTFQELREGKTKSPRIGRIRTY
jgi:hypothetical protein